MDKQTVLITGGAGFIGGHLCEKLAGKYNLIVLDNLLEQVHGQDARLPGFLEGKVEFIKADIRDREALTKAVLKANKVIHLVAETGVGQSMYEVDRYFDVTVRGTALLWDILANEKHQVDKVVLSSSRAVYGEGKYRCRNCGVVYPKGRNEEQLEKGIWDLLCEKCGEILEPLATTEDSQLNTTSIYGITKKTQEEITLVMGEALGIPVAMVRYQNVYGPRQSLKNPYTGILSIFAAQLKNGKHISVYEDGLESRDFVHVADVVQGTVLAMEKSRGNAPIYNIATGTRATVMEIAETLTRQLNPSLTPVVTGQYRFGDIRHCFADIDKARLELGYSPHFDLEKGITDFLKWASDQEAVDLSAQAEKELKEKGMLK